MHTPAAHQRFKEPTAPEPRASHTESNSLPSAAVRAPLRPRLSHRGGFTLLEIIAVLVLVGILAAVVVNRGMSSSRDLIPQENVVKTHLRFAQLKAMTDDESSSWGISFSVDSYTLQREGSDASIGLPGNNPKPPNGPNTYKFEGITITSTPNPVAFDSWGSPGTSITVTLTQGGESRSFTIADHTGFIP